MKKVFVDTNILLNNQFNLSDYEKVVTSIVSIEELDGLKHDQNVGYLARRIMKKIEQADNVEVKLELKGYEFDFMPHKNDNVILAFAQQTYKQDNEIIFLTDDYNLLIKSRTIGLPCSLFEYKQSDDNYSGWKIIQMTEKEYNYWINSDDKTNKWDLHINEYLLINSAEENGIIDCLVYTDKGFRHLSNKKIDSIYFGKFKPMDEIQLCAVDSLCNNQMVMLKGKAGSGKSLISLSYAMSMIEKGKYDQLIVFVNNVSTKNAATQGFYPGTKDEKLLDGQIGNMFGSKFGDKFTIHQLISQRKLALLPFSDIRGYDTTGMKAIVYIVEAQNLDKELMKLAIQRVGDDCQLIIDGDYNTQVDKQVFEGSNNGMRKVSELFRGYDFYGEIELKNIYRSKMGAIADKL